ncbi:MAG: biotin--[acetyl-CoA-carboxylase] ligase [Rhodanobacter sp.]
MEPLQLLAWLASGEPVDAAALAARAGVPSASIPGHVDALRARGVPVEARGNSYCLPWPLQMLDGARIRAALQAPWASSLASLEVHGELDSTSSELQRRLATASDLSIVMAESQSAGRGRLGRRWLSPPGLNLYLSCLKRFENGLAALSGLSLAVGVMVLRALGELGVSGAGLKWPNDVLAVVDDVPGKLAGILVELSGDYRGRCAAIIGIGLNLRLTPALHRQTGQPACDLASLTAGAALDRNEVAAALITALAQGLHQFQREGFAAFEVEYAQHDLLRGRPLRLTGALGTFEGMGVGVDRHGLLQVQLADGSLRGFDSADITVRRA